MSIETWDQEFYPRPASECPKEEALDDVHRRWLGFRPEALKKHGLRMDGRVMCKIDGSGDKLCLEGAFCALCKHYRCAKCPLHLIASDCCNGDGAYRTMVKSGDPEPMIALIEQAIAKRDAGKRKQQPEQVSYKVGVWGRTVLLRFLGMAESLRGAGLIGECNGWQFYSELSPFIELGSQTLQLPGINRSLDYALVYHDYDTTEEAEKVAESLGKALDMLNESLRKHSEPTEVEVDFWLIEEGKVTGIGGGLVAPGLYAETGQDDEGDLRLFRIGELGLKDRYVKPEQLAAHATRIPVKVPDLKRIIS